jgi:methyl acetate hydrolase
VEAITGKKLPDIMEEKIWKPLHMTNTTREYPEGTAKLDLHMRGPDNILTAAPEVIPKIDPDTWSGGGFAISTLNDYPQVLLALLNGGKHPTLNVRILREETVQKYIFTDQASQICSPDKIGLITTSIPAVSLTGEVLPDLKKTWSTCLLVNQEANTRGRSANSGYWCGLGNRYYFVDPTAGKCAFFATNLFPFMDLQALYLFDEMERAMYGHESKNASEKGGNYGPWEMPVTA